MRIHSDSDGDGEISHGALPGEILVFDAADGDAATLSGQSCTGRFRRRKWQPQIVSQAIRGAQRNDAQRGTRAHQALQYVLNRAVAAAGEHSIAAFGDGLFRLVGGVRCGTRGRS